MYGNEKRKFDPFLLLMGILSIVLGVLVIRNPAASLFSLIILIGIFMIVDGIIKFSQRNVMHQAGLSTGMVTFSAVLDIIIGIMIFFMKDFGAVYVWIAFAIGFIMDSGFELWGSRFIPKDHPGYYWVNVILGIIGVILGIALLFYPQLALATAVMLLAFYLVFFGILQIVKSF